MTFLPYGNPLQYSCLENPMVGGAWCRLVSMRSQRVGHDWAISLHFCPISKVETFELLCCPFLHTWHIISCFTGREQPFGIPTVPTDFSFKFVFSHSGHVIFCWPKSLDFSKNPNKLFGQYNIMESLINNEILSSTKTGYSFKMVKGNNSCTVATIMPQQIP